MSVMNEVGVVIFIFYGVAGLCGPRCDCDERPMARRPQKESTHRAKYIETHVGSQISSQVNSSQ